MAKFMSGATVTVENETGRYVFKTQGVSVSSTTGGASHHVRVEPHAHMVEKGERPSSIPFAQGGVPGMSINTTKREAVIKHVLEMAKAVEKQKFEGARLVELAEAEAIDAENKKLHEFNLAVLSALHEGLSATQVGHELVAAGLLDFDEDARDVNLRDVSALYPRVAVDVEE